MRQQRVQHGIFCFILKYSKRVTLKITYRPSMEIIINLIFSI